MDLQRGFVLHRRPYSETSLLVDLFTEETGRLTVIAKGARAKRSAWKSLYSGFYVNELITRVIEPETANPQLFQHYLQCLTGLATQPQVEPTLRLFEFHLLKILGYGIDFLHCAGSGLPVDESMTYQYRAEKGFIASLVKDNLTFYGRDLLAFDRLEFTDESVLLAAKRFTRIALKPYLGDKPLKSRELFTQNVLYLK